MGKGSTKNERKANPKRVSAYRAQYEKARIELASLEALPINQRPLEYSLLLQTQRGIISRARLKMKRSENDTQSGKRGRE